MKGGGNNEILVRGNKLLIIRWINSGKPMYNMVIIGNTIVILKSSKRIYFKCKELDYSNHFTIYMYNKSQCTI